MQEFAELTNAKVNWMSWDIATSRTVIDHLIPLQSIPLIALHIIVSAIVSAVTDLLCSLVLLLTAIS